MYRREKIANSSSLTDPRSSPMLKDTGEERKDAKMIGG
jgi:hypothetical protein